MDALSQLDELIESDILEALGQPNVQNNETKEEEIQLEDLNEELEENEIVLEDIQSEPTETNTNNNENIITDEISLHKDEEKNSIQNNVSMNSSDLATLLSELLNNKTIEITIKIKD